MHSIITCHFVQCEACRQDQLLPLPKMLTTIGWYITLFGVGCVWQMPCKLPILGSMHQASMCLLQVFLDSSMPVINHYEGKGKVRRFDATPPPEEVFKKVRQLFVQQPAKVV